MTRYWDNHWRFDGRHRRWPRSDRRYLLYAHYRDEADARHAALELVRETSSGHFKRAVVVAYHGDLFNLGGKWEDI